MAVRVILGIMAKQDFPSEVMNSVMYLGRQYYSTAQKVVKISTKKPALTNQQCISHNKNIPSYAEVKKDPSLQRRLAQMYKRYARDPDFNEVTIDSMRLGVRSLARAKVN